jgi:trehalose 6-phosphate synthase
MRLSLRFILPLVIALMLIAYGVVPLVEELTFKWFVRDLDVRAQLVSDTISDPLIPLVEKSDKNKIQALFNRMIRDERLFGIGFCDLSGKMLYKSHTYPDQVKCAPNRIGEFVFPLQTGAVHVSYKLLQNDSQQLGQVVLVHDMSFIERRGATTREYLLYFFLGLGIVTSVITVLVAQLSLKGWISGIRTILKGEGLIRLKSHRSSPEIRPIVKDLRILIQDLERERKVRDELQISWTPRTLKDLLQRELAGDEVLIVSNREPYIHQKKDDKIEVQVPASGLVTALEPIMRACSGTWIAHGSGNADREVVDKFDRVRVPPENPSYQIRRVWLTEEEEKGFYYGFSNEGMWPLCHIAHTRPVFRSEDWNQYVEVNRKFAQAVLQEAKTEDPVILVQDYHFALLPKMVRKKLPKATIITFWHIPWPNSETFGICPWREEILDGLLGSSIIGFHTRFHCNNFIEAVDRYLECRIDRETSTISYKRKLTAVNHYPISIEWPPRLLSQQRSIPECRTSIRNINAMDSERLIGIGVDRLDYTKGILERFLAVERLLELNPKMVGRFSFIQIAAPSRSHIDSYQNFDQEVRKLANKINEKFGRDDYQPIHLKVEHHGAEKVFEYFRGSDVCFVSSLHDGMNLVAKEFIAARDDEQGVLILSQFTGASRELPASLIVNPYNIDQCAQALNLALTMPKEEQRERMRSMRGLVQEFNVYRWAGKMLMDAARTRQRYRLMSRVKESSLRLFSSREAV